MASAEARCEIAVLKFGSSVLRSEADLPDAVQCIYRHVRAGQHVVAVVSAFAGTTDRLFAQARERALDDPATAEHVARGEKIAAAALVAELDRCGIPAVECDPPDVRLHASGPALDAMLDSVDAEALRGVIANHAVTVLPGFYACDTAGRTVLLGRGGSDLSAVWIADRLGAHCTLVKDVDGLYQRDPALPGPPPPRLQQASWSTALAVGSSLLQTKAIEYAYVRRQNVSVGSLLEHRSTLIGPGPDLFASERRRSSRPLRVALLGCGTVGYGVYQRLCASAQLFEIVGVLVRNQARHAAKAIPPELLCTERSEILGSRPDIVIELIGGVDHAGWLIEQAIRDGSHVVTANKEVLAHRWNAFAPYLRGRSPRLRCSAAVGGSVPMLERVADLAAHNGPVTLRGVINGTTNYVLERIASGSTRASAVREAQRLGFAEANPRADLDGSDAACKLSLIARLGLGIELEPTSIDVIGITDIDVGWVRHEARAGRRVRLLATLDTHDGAVTARIAPRSVDGSDFMAGACNEENRLEVRSADGLLARLAGKGAGRWPTTTGVFADLLDVARESRAAAGLRATDTVAIAD